MINPSRKKEGVEGLDANREESLTMLRLQLVEHPQPCEIPDYYALRGTIKGHFHSYYEVGSNVILIAKSPMF